MKRCARAENTEQCFRWYSLNPRSIHLRGILGGVLLVALLLSMSEKHIWRWDWQHGVHAWMNCHAVTAADGRQLEAWRWVEGREIRLYVPTTMSAYRAERIADGMRRLVRELQLSIAVTVLPITPRVSAALQCNTATVQGQPSINFDRFCRTLIATRDGHYAEMVIAPATLDGSADTLGEAYFSYGVAVMDARSASGFLARHETGHLLGYHLHDNWPFAVVGYSNPKEWAAALRGHQADPPLMLPSLEGSHLSPRSRDALVSFWHSLERRTGESYFAAN
ncbi:MAG TPA: hypothetical protein VGL77_08565 [Armatimonadota bacterium]|jgi:ethanolamine utilization microcompartment shell protein EutS